VILAFHSIFSTYGTWLPNEPRGSWSDFVRSWELFRFGPATKVDTTRSVAHRPYDHATKRQMQAALARPPARLTGEQARLVGASFQLVPYIILALAILPDHVHAVIAHTPRHIRRVVGHIKSEATRQLRAHGHFLDATPWADHGWNVYLDSDEDVVRSIKYVHDNPLREGLPIQGWNCVAPCRQGLRESGAG
jgi:REP element-mobilizing transposase RayT